MKRVIRSLLTLVAVGGLMMGGLVAMSAPASASGGTCTKVGTGYYRPLDSSGSWRCYMYYSGSKAAIAAFQESYNTCYAKKHPGAFSGKTFLVEDGVWGWRTSKAVRLVQYDEGLRQDSRYGPATASRMEVANKRWLGNCR